MKKLILFIMGFVSCYFNLYAFEFMGVEFYGNVETVADKYAEKGFYRTIGIVQEGPNKGKKEIVKLDEWMLLRGTFLGKEADLMLNMENKDDIVTGFALTIKNMNNKELFKLFLDASEFFIKQYGYPIAAYNYMDSLTEQEKVFWGEDIEYDRFIRVWKIENEYLSLSIPIDENMIEILNFK